MAPILAAVVDGPTSPVDRPASALPRLRPPGYEHFVRSRFELRVLEWEDVRLETYLRQQAEPSRAAEQTLDVPIVFDAHDAVGSAQQAGVVDHVGRVGRIGIERPFQVPQPVGLTVMSTMIGRCAEVLADEIGATSATPPGLQ